LSTLYPTEHHETDTMKEATKMTAPTDLTPETVDELRALWDRLRDEAISDADRHEIDEVFARRLP
jgi:hypothetical protein